MDGEFYDRGKLTVESSVGTADYPKKPTRPRFLFRGTACRGARTVVPPTLAVDDDVLIRGVAMDGLTAWKVPSVEHPLHDL